MINKVNKLLKNIKNQMVNKRTYLKIVLLFLSLNLSGCCCRYMSSPAIWMFNLSDNFIYDVRGDWNGYGIRATDELSPGGPPSFSFNVKYQSDIFGPVKLTWKNAKGEIIIKEFEFKKHQLPNTRHHNLDHIYLFFTQDDLEIFTEGRGQQEPQEVKERWQKAKEFSKEFRKKCPQGRRNCKI